MKKLDQITNRAKEELQEETHEWPRTKQQLQDLISHISKKHLPVYFHTALHIAQEHEPIWAKRAIPKDKWTKTPIRMILRNIEEYITGELFKTLSD